LAKQHCVAEKKSGELAGWSGSTPRCMITWLSKSPIAKNDWPAPSMASRLWELPAAVDCESDPPLRSHDSPLLLVENDACPAYGSPPAKLRTPANTVYRALPWRKI
jgi:hypothetical protein